MLLKKKRKCRRVPKLALEPPFPVQSVHIPEIPLTHFVPVVEVVGLFLALIAQTKIATGAGCDSSLVFVFATKEAPSSSA